MLHIDGLCSRYGRIEVLHGISLDVQAGEIVTLVGSNGAGKTTLLRAISGVQPVASGTINFQDKTINTLPPHRRVKLGIAQVPEGRQVFAPLSVEDNLRLGAFTRADAEIGRDIDEMYQTFPALAEKRDRDGWHAVRRATADAGDRPRLDDPAQARPAGRAVNGTGPCPGRADLLDHRGPESTRSHRSCWSSRMPMPRSASPIGPMLSKPDAL